MLTRADPSLDGPVILFQNIVEILHRSMPAILLQSASGFELYDGWRVSGVLVGVDDPRVRMVRTSQGFGSESARPLLGRAWPKEYRQTTLGGSTRPTSGCRGSFSTGGYGRLTPRFDLRFKLAPLEQSGNRSDTEHPSILAARSSGQASKVATLPHSRPASTVDVWDICLGGLLGGELN